MENQAYLLGVNRVGRDGLEVAHTGGTCAINPMGDEMHRMDHKPGIKSVTLDLKKLREKDIPFLRRKIGIVFQDFQLLPDRTVNANMLFVMEATGWKKKAEMQIRSEQLLDKVGILDKKDKNALKNNVKRIQIDFLSL